MNTHLISTKVLKSTTQERKVLIVFYVIADMISNKKLHPVVTDLFIRSWKLNISLTFINSQT